MTPPTPTKTTAQKDAEIIRSGTQIVLPDGMTYDDAIKWCLRKKEEEEQDFAIHHVIDATPLEGALALMRALKAMFGWTNLIPTPGFFGGKTPPALLAVETGVGEHTHVAWGRMEVPGIAGYLQTSMHINAVGSDRGLKFVLHGVSKLRHKEKIAELADLVRRMAREQSMYRGKAIRATFPDLRQDDSPNPFNYAPKFIDTRDIKEHALIFPAGVARMVDTTIFTPLRHTQACRDTGVPLKRGILLEGPFGTGKTLTAHVAAKIATDHGWTFIYLENVERLPEALSFARAYQPAVIFAEDIDRADNDGERNDQMNSILNTIDGIEAKGTEIMVVLTTNHVENITQAMLRPGRLDAVIPVRPPDAEAAARLVRSFAGFTLPAGEDLTGVGQKLAGQIPATIREVVERSKLAAIARTAHAAFTLTAADLDVATDSMIAHMKLLEPQPNDERSPMEKAAQILADAMKGRRPNGAPVSGYIAGAVPLASLTAADN